MWMRNCHRRFIVADDPAASLDMPAMPMRLHKTPKAREMLTRNGPELSQLERRILILCDGRRDLATLLKMLGPEAGASVDVMRQQGYLDGSAPMATPVTATAHAEETRGLGLARGLNRLLGTGQRTATSETSSQSLHGAAASNGVVPSVAAATSTASPAAVVPPSSHVTASARGGTRRSISAAKMYMLDMLQLQRSLEASSIAVSIQTSSGEDSLVDALLEGLAHLASSTKPSMSERIASRLAEILPEPHLDALDRCWSGAAPRSDATPTNVIPMERYA